MMAKSPFLHLLERIWWPQVACIAYLDDTADFYTAYGKTQYSSKENASALGFYYKVTWNFQIQI